ncbi:MAG TPA: hypothetical protein VIK93_02380 [Limnochordales bacterium]
MGDKEVARTIISVIERIPRRPPHGDLLLELRRTVERVRRTRPFLRDYDLADVHLGPAGPDLRVILAFAPRTRRNRLHSAEPLPSGR